MNILDDLAAIAEQERLLRFQTFSAETAWQIGSALRSAALLRNAAMTFQVEIAGRLLFHTVTGEAPAAQADWIRRKRNSVLRFSRCTYALGLELAHSGKTLEARHEGLALIDYAMHGGGFPIVLAEAGCIGAIVASGLSQRIDHNLVVDALCTVLQCEAPRLNDEN